MKNKNFIILVIGQIISLFGNAIQRFSMSLYLLEFTGSAATFANILAISTIPYVLFAPIAGKLSDSFSRKKIMVYLDLFCSVLIGSYAFVLLRGHDHKIIVAAVMFILSICYTLYGPAVTSSITMIVEEDKLTSANGIINQVGSIVNFAGPIIAGVLYGFLGIKIIVVINAVSFLFSAVMEMFMDIPDVAKSDEKAAKEKLVSAQFVKNSFIEMKESFVYLKKEKKIVLGIIASYAMCNIFLVPILSIIAPYFINTYLKMPSQVYGVVEGISVLGMIIGGFIISVRPKMFSMKNIHHTFIPMISGAIAMAFVVVLKMNRYTMAGLFALCGLFIMMSIALSNVLTLTFIQKAVPQDMLGRVSAFSTAVATISVAPGQILYGQIIERGVPLFVIMAVTAVLNIGLAAFNKWNVRELRD
ncbi:MAG: MFS transporter [Inconstantimicrobium porci]|uniref:MFS transporter n=1 Tax=Inconstantimicrobium porci TaxID=2652291 RepID=A0A7X2T328_9CLOT|nr:MFS transporter [Inconstantimicrobium porci]MDD6769466.1 MFS transporter [Inconstantimicrobium porci]MDY5911904.1 MFS transporter [Inconstantimicrobium porci]MSR92583.1 MFS transporter [Inconstantimicrobium porci]